MTAFQDPVTQYNVIVGAANKALASVAPSATSGVPIISQGSSSNPTFGTALPAGGGTGLSSLTAYAIIAAGTTSTGNFQQLSAGSSGQILRSGGSSALASWSTATYPATAGSSGNVLTSDGTNWTSAAPTGGGGGYVPTLTYIGSGTASGGTVNFTSLSSSYKGYRFYVVGLTPSATDIVIMRVSTDNGSNYVSTGVYQMVSASSGTNFSTSTQTGFPIHPNANTTSARNGYVDMYFHATANAIVTFAAYITASTGSSCWNTGTYPVQANVNAVQFTVVGANNLSSGTIYQFGIT